MLNRVNNKCVVLVTSCCKYKDVLRNFEYFFRKHWKDCPFEIWLSIDKPVNSDFEYDRVILSDHPQNLVRMRDIDFVTPYVIMMQDDHWLIEDVNTKKILECIENAIKYDCGNLRLLRDPFTNEVFSEEEGLYIYKLGTAYRISARGGLWDVDYLRVFINQYADFWEMERFGNEYSKTLPQKVLATKHRCLPIIDAVRKGKYENFATFLLDANGIEPERKSMKAKERLIEDFKGTVLEFNPNLITKIQAKLNIGYKPKYNTGK